MSDLPAPYVRVRPSIRTQLIHERMAKMLRVDNMMMTILNFDGQKRRIVAKISSFFGPWANNDDGDDDGWEFDLGCHSTGEWKCWKSLSSKSKKRVESWLKLRWTQSLKERQDKNDQKRQHVTRDWPESCIAFEHTIKRSNENKNPVQTWAGETNKSEMNLIIVYRSIDVVASIVINHTQSFVILLCCTLTFERCAGTEKKLNIQKTVVNDW